MTSTDAALAVANEQLPHFVELYLDHLPPGVDAEYSKLWALLRARLPADQAERIVAIGAFLKALEDVG